MAASHTTGKRMAEESASWDDELEDDEDDRIREEYRKRHARCVELVEEAKKNAKPNFLQYTLGLLSLGADRSHYKALLRINEKAYNLEPLKLPE